MKQTTDVETVKFVSTLETRIGVLLEAKVRRALMISDWISGMSDHYEAGKNESRATITETVILCPVQRN